MIISIQPSGSVGRVQKISHFEAVFRDLASGCAKLTLAAYNCWDEVYQAFLSVPRPEDFRQYLWVVEDADLVIRTGFGSLLSNFLSFQVGCVELLFISKYFNDIDALDVIKAIRVFPISGNRLLGG